MKWEKGLLKKQQRCWHCVLEANENNPVATLLDGHCQDEVPKMGVIIDVQP